MTASNQEEKPLSQSEHETIQRLNQQAVEAFLNRSKGVEALCQQILSLAAPEGLEHPSDTAGAAEALQTLGRVYMARTDYGKALDLFQKSLQLCEQGGLLRQAPAARSYMGVVFTSLGDYSRAVELLRQAHSEAEAIQDVQQVAEILNDLSYTYVLAGEPELALNYLQRSIQIFRELHDDMRLSWSLESLGRAYLQVDRKDEALASVLECLDLASRHGFWLDVARFTQSAGEMYRAVGDLVSAHRMFEESLNLARAYGMPDIECAALLSIAEFFLAEAHYTRALELLEHAEQIALVTGIKPHLRQCYLLLSRVYKYLGSYQQALDYHEHFYEVDKEIFNADTDQRLRNVQALYQLETAKKETELYQLRAQALQLEVEERRRTEVVLERMASTDPLTDLLNRRAFFDLAEKAFLASVKNGFPLSIILIDIDHFKQVNDEHGHLVGDHALALVADRLRNRLRSRDRIARYGGEEFIVLLNEVNPADALVMAERLREAVADSPIQARGVVVPVTLSLGVAGMDLGEPLESLDQLIAQADQALFLAKRNGRNASRLYNLPDR